MITNQALYQLSYSSALRRRTGPQEGANYIRDQAARHAAAPKDTQPRGRVRTMMSTPSVSTPGGSGGSPSTLMSSAGMSVSFPVTTS